MENVESILTVKIIERRKFIDYFGLSIDANPSRVGKKNIHFPYWIHTKPFIRKSSYSKEPAGKRV